MHKTECLTEDQLCPAEACRECSARLLEEFRLCHRIVTSRHGRSKLQIRMQISDTLASRDAGSRAAIDLKLHGTRI